MWSVATRKRFGPPSPKIEAALNAIKDVERLDASARPF
jgi:hypothetical protein